MCLIVDEEKTQKMKKELKGWRTVWKIYKVSPPYTIGDEGKMQVYSPLQNMGPLNPGRITSNRRTAKYPYRGWSKYPGDIIARDKIKIKSGIHICLTRKAARKYVKKLRKFCYNVNIKIFRCRGHMVNFIAAGTSEYLGVHDNMAVFHSMMVSPEDWEKALNGDFR